MRTVEMRRHTMRVKPGRHLSQAGVDLARRTGHQMGPFDRVLTSTVARAYETAIAMGFAVDQQHDRLRSFGVIVDAEIAWDAGFAAWSQVVSEGGAAAHFAHRQVALLGELAASLPEGGRALVITHGGFVEAAAVASLPQADHAAWGAVCDYCEGAVFQFEGDQVIAVDVVRV